MRSILASEVLRRRSIDRWLLTSTVAGTTLFLVTAALLHVLRPELDPRVRFLSDYAVGPYGALMNVGLVAISLGSLALGVVFARRPTTSTCHTITSIALVFNGIEICLLILFPTDGAQGRETRALVRGWITHDDIAAAQILTTLLGAICGTRAAYQVGAARTTRRAATLAGSAVLITFCILFYFRNHYPGVGQRLWACSNAAWLLVYSAQLLRQRRGVECRHVGARPAWAAIGQIKLISASVTNGS